MSGNEENTLKKVETLIRDEFCGDTLPEAIITALNGVRDENRRAYLLAMVEVKIQDYLAKEVGAQISDDDPRIKTIKQNVKGDVLVGFERRQAGGQNETELDEAVVRKVSGKILEETWGTDRIPYDILQIRLQLHQEGKLAAFKQINKKHALDFLGEETGERIEPSDPRVERILQIVMEKIAQILKQLQENIHDYVERQAQILMRETGFLPLEREKFEQIASIPNERRTMELFRLTLEMVRSRHISRDSSFKTGDRSLIALIVENTVRKMQQHLEVRRMIMALNEGEWKECLAKIPDGEERETLVRFIMGELIKKGEYKEMDDTSALDMITVERSLFVEKTKEKLRKSAEELLELFFFPVVGDYADLLEDILNKTAGLAHAMIVSRIIRRGLDLEELPDGQQSLIKVARTLVNVMLEKTPELLEQINGREDQGSNMPAECTAIMVAAIQASFPNLERRQLELLLALASEELIMRVQERGENESEATAEEMEKGSKDPATRAKAQAEIDAYLGEKTVEYIFDQLVAIPGEEGRMDFLRGIAEEMDERLKNEQPGLGARERFAIYNTAINILTERFAEIDRARKSGME